MKQKVNESKIRKSVREGYAKVAKRSSGPSVINSCGCGTSGYITTPSFSCCGPSTNSSTTSNLADTISTTIGYSDKEINSVPEGANLGLGCGNPTAHASIKEGEIVLDLGSGAGFDVFLAAQRVGKTGKVIGVDMTPEMIDKARENARKDNYENVEFRLGEIENLPVADETADLIISNCVINLSPNKERVFQEAFRVLKPGGRLMISDIVLLEELPEFIKNNIDAYIGCVSGAIMKDEYLRTIKEVGFQEIKIIQETTFPIDLILNIPNVNEFLEKFNLSPEKVKGMASTVVSLKVQANKPI